MNLLRQPPLRWPCHGFISKSAARYADASVDHTHTYDGWDAAQARERILVGRTGQEWLRAFCKANGLHCEVDTTDEKTPDLFDLKVNGRIVDVKTSSHSTLWPQVGAHLQGKSEIYAFVRVGGREKDGVKTITWEQFCGWMPAKGVFLVPNFVAFGKPLPGGEHLTQRFKTGSYFVTEEDLFSEHQFIAAMTNTEVMQSFMNIIPGEAWPEDMPLLGEDAAYKRFKETNRIY